MGDRRSREIEAVFGWPLAGLVASIDVDGGEDQIVVTAPNAPAVAPDELATVEWVAGLFSRRVGPWKPREHDIKVFRSEKQTTVRFDGHSHSFAGEVFITIFWAQLEND